MNCYRCDHEITNENESEEHIILNSCGGRLKTKELLCASCNSIFGNKFDFELANTTNDIANLLMIKRQDGKPQPIPTTRTSWIINGWQSYGKFNSMPGIGGNITWTPNSSLKLLTNNYYGTDAAGNPKRKRFHSDNSLLVRYYNSSTLRGITKMAFSLTSDIGFEKGGDVNGFKDGDSTQGPAQYFASVMFYNRIWFAKNKCAWTIGGGFMTNPGRYLVLSPTGQASPLPNPNNPSQTEGAFPFSANPGDKFSGWDCSTNFDFMPNQSITFRLEFVYRNSNVPYFAGQGGVTSQTGYTTSTLDPNWRPDLVKSETRLIAAILFRL